VPPGTTKFLVCRHIVISPLSTRTQVGREPRCPRTGIAYSEGRRRPIISKTIPSLLLWRRSFAYEVRDMNLFMLALSSVYCD